MLSHSEADVIKIMNSDKEEEEKIEELFNAFDGKLTAHLIVSGCPGLINGADLYPDGWEEWHNPLVEVEVEVTDDEAEEGEEVDAEAAKDDTQKEAVRAPNGKSHKGHNHSHGDHKHAHAHAHAHSNGSATRPTKKAKV